MLKMLESEIKVGNKINGEVIIGVDGPFVLTEIPD